MKVATWNVNSLNVRLPHVLRWLEGERPDALALQETKLTDDRFPVEALAEVGYHAAFSGQKTYNGVALLTREPASGVLADLPRLDDPERRTLCATVSGVRVLNLYVVNGREVGSEPYARKLDWLARVARFVEEEAARCPELVVLGDFNVAPEDRDVYDPEAWRESILCSAAEREALRRLAGAGALKDVFRRFEQPERSFSWWDYRQGAFRRGNGLRIDLILASRALAARCRACRIDPEPRGWERPSDHTPVVAEFGPGPGGGPASRDEGARG